MLDRKATTKRVVVSSVILGFSWTLVLAAICGWTVAREYRAADRILHEQILARFDLDHAIRLWATGHGGVYVPVSEQTPPSPYLADVPDRDIVTPSGRQLTLMNPAYVLRQLNEQFPVLYGISGHTTSVRPLRPENTPDQWEKKALLAFEEGAEEIVEEVEIAGIPHLRLMHPVKVEQRCLKCHQQQGYKIGDIRGGVSVVLPSGTVHKKARTTAALLGISFAAIWLLGLAGIAWNANKISYQIGELADINSALVQSEQRQELALDGASLGLWDWQIQSGHVVLNERWAEMLGYRLEDLEPNVNTWKKLIHPEDMPRVLDALDTHLEGSTPFYETTYRVLTKSGEWKWILDKGRVVEWDDQNRPVRASGTHLDVTEQEEAQRELAVSERLLEQERRLFITGPTVVFRWRAAEGWPVIYVSPNITEVFGYDPGDLVSGRIPFAGIVHPEDLGRVADEVARHVKEGAERFMQEYRIRCSDGRWAPIRDWTIIERGEDGSPLFFLGYILDVTEQQQAEEDRRQLEAQIQHSQKLESLGVLAGGIAHDFNNLLMVILGNADLARELLGSAHPAEHHLLDIETASKQAADLCRQMLAYSGKGRFVVEKLDLQAVVHEITHMLEVSISKNVVLRFDFAANLLPIEADASQISQVVMNLVTNAAEAIGDRSGVVSIRTGVLECDQRYLSSVYKEGKLEEGIYVYLEVADTGSGMVKEVVDRIFEPFFTTKFTGRGLGMAAVLGIVRGHGGAIKIYSEPGQGTTIKVLFPAVEGDAVEVSNTRNEEEEDTWRGSGLVLVVDDEETVRVLASTMLRKIGFDVITACDGREGLDLFRERWKEIRFVLLDLTMPHMNGEDAFREMRQIDGNAKVLMTSGYNEQEIVQRFTGKGLSGFVQKPFQISKLRDCIRGLL